MFPQYFSNQDTQAVVEGARDKTSPLHDRFEWNDLDAAEKFRRFQALNLLKNALCIQDVLIKKGRI